MAAHYPISKAVDPIGGGWGVRWIAIISRANWFSFMTQTWEVFTLFPSTWRQGMGVQLRDIPFTALDGFAFIHGGRSQST